MVAGGADRDDARRSVGDRDGLRPVRRGEGRDATPPPRVGGQPRAGGHGPVVVAHGDQADGGQGDVEQVGLTALIGLRVAEATPG